LIGVWRPFKKGHWTTYNTSDGLPSNSIRKLWYDVEDGSLWIATSGGVSRFDGKEFTSLAAEDGSLDGNINDLLREPSGIWWFCADGGVVRYDPSAGRAGRKVFNTYQVPGGAEHVARTLNGQVFFGNAVGGISRLDGEHLTLDCIS
jgi:streptogramin lyase